MPHSSQDMNDQVWPKLAIGSINAPPALSAYGPADSARRIWDVDTTHQYNTTRPFSTDRGPHLATASLSTASKPQASMTY